MISYIQIKDDLTIVHQEIKRKNEVKVTKREPVNHIYVYDRSGSMYYYLPKLCKQMVDMAKKIPNGDFLTIGWYSSEGGEFEWIVKGFKIIDTSDYALLEKIIMSNSSSKGCTCFSEILLDTEKVINDLSNNSKNFALHLLTDGYPCVSNYNKEIENIFKAIDLIKGKINCSVITGFGEYYNKELLLQMSEKLGAILIHTSQIEEFMSTSDRLTKLSMIQEPKEEVIPPVSNPLAVYTITDEGVMINSLDKDGKLYINPQQGKSSNVFYIINDKPNKKSWDKIDINNVDFGDKEDIVSKGLYAAALILTQQTKTDVAIEVLGKIGDKKLIDSCNNAFTIQEYGNVEKDIESCVYDITKRFENGRDKNYLPPIDAFSVFDMLNVLMEDNQSAFYPFQEKFQYQRTGVKTVTADGYPEFKPDKNSKCYFNRLVWNESRLNLSVQTEINGTVELNSVDGKKPISYNLQDVYPAFVYRNYTFIKDGRTNFKSFYLTSSEKTYIKFKTEGIVIDDTFKVDGIYGVDISRIPVINRKVANSSLTGTELCNLVYKEQEIKAKIKSLKYLKKQECGEEEVKVNNLTSEQIQFLLANGINPEKNNLFSPPVEKEEATDKYVAKEFSIDIKGLSSLPSVKDVQKKIDSKKARTPRELLVEEGIKMFESTKTKLIKEDVKKEWFDSTIKSLRDELKEISLKIQETKFSVIMAKKWFPEFKNYSEKELTVNNNLFTFNLSEKVVAI